MVFESVERLAVRYVSLNDHTPGQGQYRDLDGYKERMEAWAEQRGRGVDVPTDADRRAHARARRRQRDGAHGLRAHLREERQRLGFDDRLPRRRLAGEGRRAADLGAACQRVPGHDRSRAQQARERGMTIIVGAPNIVRGGSPSGNLDASELFALGLADIICADYHAPSLLPAAFRLVDDGVDRPAGGGPMPDAQRRRAPSALDDRGAIEPGLLRRPDARPPRGPRLPQRRAGLPRRHGACEPPGRPGGPPRVARRCRR